MIKEFNVKNKKINVSALVINTEEINLILVLDNISLSYFYGKEMLKLDIKNYLKSFKVIDAK